MGQRQVSLAAVAFGAIWLTFVGGVATASIGVSLNVSRIDVDRGLTPGATYELPTVVVSNPGTRPGDFEMTVGHLEGQRELWPELAWFGFTPGSFPLEPDGQQEVDVTLEIPPDAEAGDYSTLLKAQVVPDATGGVAGAAAAAYLTFQVVGSRGGGPALGQFVPWLAVGALVVVLASLGRRFRFRVERRT